MHGTAELGAFSPSPTMLATSSQARRLESSPEEGDSPVAGWYIAKSNPRKETLVEATLAHYGVEVYAPRIRVRRRGRQIVEVLFPTYLFCNFDPTSPDWPAIYRAPGLNYFLGADGHPTQVPADLVSCIIQRVDCWNSRGYGGRSLKFGDPITVANGPLIGLEGIFQRYVPSRHRCRILLEVVGRLTAVELDEASLASAVPRQHQQR